MAGVTFRGVRKEFGGSVAVDDFDLEIQDREFLVLLGPSGSGKSTALRMVAGLEEPTSGSLSIGDDVVDGVDPRDRDIAMVFQSYALYPHMTVAQNIEAPLRARAVLHPGESTPRRATKAERSAAVAEAAEMLGLDGLLDRKPGALSGGQRQRVALARAIVRRPKVFLMDEPLSNLDAKLRTQTRIELVDLWRRLGTTFVYVTHDQVEAMTMATRIAVMSEGVLQQVGTPGEIYDAPANLFVAQFIGSPPMNVLPGVIVIAGDAAAVSVGGVAVTLGSTHEDRLRPGDAVVVGVRPEHLVVALDGSLPGTVRSVELLGHERHVIVDVADETVIVRQRTTDAPVAPGDLVCLRVTPEHVHLFDRGTGDRIAPKPTFAPDVVPA